MRKIIFILFLIFLYFQGIGETLDSLKTKREMLYQKYSEINIPGKKLSDKDLTKVIDILKDLVIVDTRIIKEYGNSDEQLKENAIIIKDLKSDIEIQNKEKENTTDLLFLIYIAGGLIVILLVLSIVLLFIYVLKYSKLRKKWQDGSILKMGTENDHNKLSKLNEMVSVKDKEIERLNQQIIEFKDEKSVMIGRIKKLEESVIELQGASHDTSSVSDGNAGTSKIEKLVRMKELGIVTEEEFNTFKQKFLEEM